MFILPLIGLFFIYNNTKNNEQNFADKTKGEKIAPIENNNSTTIEKINQPIENNTLVPNQVASVVKNNNVKIVRENNSERTPVIVNESPILPIAVNVPENKKEIEHEKVLLANNEQTTKSNSTTETTNNDAIASIIGKSKTIGASTGYLSLRELATERIKEKTLDNETLEIQKKNGRLKRFSGWDLAQIVTRGISKVTGRDVEVKPTYSDDGDVTAYALGGGLQVTRGK